MASSTSLILEIFTIYKKKTGFVFELLEGSFPQVRYFNTLRDDNNCAFGKMNILCKICAEFENKKNKTPLCAHCATWNPTLCVNYAEL